MDINIKDIPEKTANILQRKAKALNLTRAEFLRRTIADFIDPNFLQISSHYFKDEIVKRSKEPASSSDALSSIAERDLNRYYKLLRQAQIPVFSENELMLMIDAFNGCLIDFAIAPSSTLILNIQDAIAIDNLSEKWEVDADFLLTKLKSLNDLQCAYLLDGIERFWSGETYKIEDNSEALKATGLIAHMKPNFSPTHVVMEEGKVIEFLMEFEGDFYTSENWHLGTTKSWEIRDNKVFFQGILTQSNLAEVKPKL